ncbi:hypothetical protein HIM_10068 [Hirsutella minnesotensis 3608]|uniref:Chromo domain-containing protein n=1 Tax=Hirsutella minnesotensis 3608 TaxID=1043627 RepID=A0A0F8A2M3_9HYPO|nr:hypothetical protein HIM_10068 [Hirsutella minnesotensis 3608]
MRSRSPTKRDCSCAWTGTPPIWFTINPNDIHNPVKMRLSSRRLHDYHAAKGLLADLRGIYDRIALSIMHPVISAIFFHREISLFFEKYIRTVDCWRWLPSFQPRNLEYFMTRQKLTERQSRWAAELSQFDFKLEYRPGCQAVVPDALSRREQDKPQGIDDEREQGRMVQLIPDDAIPVSTRARIHVASLGYPEGFLLPEMKVFEEADLQQLWDETAAKDPIFQGAYRAVQNRDRAFPPSLGLKVQISECAIDNGKRLTFRDRIWVPGGSGEKGDQDEAEKDRFWKRFCNLAGVTQKLSTAYHPQTDGGTERMNQEIEAYLRAYVSYVQDDWGELLPAAQLALNNRESATTRISPFFVEHGYHVDLISVEDSDEPPHDKEESKADALLTRLKEVNEYMQAAAERFEVGDKVWLSMANYRSPRPCKKLDWLHHKYTVTKVISSHVVELDARGSIYRRFHVDLLRRAYQDPAPGQKVDDAQPPAIQDETGEDLWDVDEILCARWKKRGRGEYRQALVRWTGYADPTWEPVEWLQGTIAMKAFEDKYGPIKTNYGPREIYDALAGTREPRRRRPGRRGEGG